LAIILQVYIYKYSGYQLVQEKIVKIMATVQAALFATWRISKLAD
jgi:hypothetical protein